MASHPTQETGGINSASSTSTIVNSSDIPRPGGEPPKEIVQQPSPVASPYAGAGTEEDPYVVEWLEGDKENPYNCAFLVQLLFGLVRARARLNALSCSSPCSLDNRDKDQEVGHYGLCGDHDPLHRCVPIISRGLLESSSN